METRKYNRPPTKKELLAHAPLIDDEIAKIEPPFILTMGNIALHRLIGDTETISSAHGKLYRGPIQFLPDSKALSIVGQKRNILFILLFIQRQSFILVN